MKSPTIALLLLAPIAFGIGRAQGLSSARVFVMHVYAQYTPPSGVKESDFMGPDFLHGLAPNVFSPSLLRLIRNDEEKTPQGDVGKLDFDPICACQDPDVLKLTNLTITPIAQIRAVAVVKLHYPQPKEITIRLKLIQTPQGWRIDDIAEPEIPSLRRYLSLGPVPHRP